MPDIDITAADAHEYDVELRPDDGDTSSRHRVSVSPEFVHRLGLTAAQEPALVRASVAYLLQQDAPRALPQTLVLDDVERVHPDYPEQIPLWV